MPEEKRIVATLKEHVIRIGDWLCDLRVDAYKGQRMATKFKPGTLYVETRAEWCRVDEEGEPIPEDEQGLMISTEHTTGTVFVPVAVVEWLRWTKGEE